MAGYFDSRASKWMIWWYVHRNHIDLSRFVVPEKGFASFNDFFIRQLNPEFRTNEGTSFVSPCDGLLTVKRIDRMSSFTIKNSVYTVPELLKDADLAREYEGGTALIFRLTPSHYHRYCYCTDGIVSDMRRIDGVLHTVRPLAVENERVFLQNSRDFTVISSLPFGEVVQMEVGALLVGKISNHLHKAGFESVLAGEEKGYFEYGGSTIIVLLDQEIILKEEIRRRERVGDEIPVHIGEALLKEY
ncbi:MAG: phosphatidylserine decarboxylase [Lachnospiraceae bacterium]|nr:phosphatidylserine decarboxylase [Lachnospiraceae bacterium]